MGKKTEWIFTSSSLKAVDTGENEFSDVATSLRLGEVTGKKLKSQEVTSTITWQFIFLSAILLAFWQIFQRIQISLYLYHWKLLKQKTFLILTEFEGINLHTKLAKHFVGLQKHSGEHTQQRITLYAADVFDNYINNYKFVRIWRTNTLNMAAHNVSATVINKL